MFDMCMYKINELNRGMTVYYILCGTPYLGLHDLCQQKCKQLIYMFVKS